MATKKKKLDVKQFKEPEKRVPPNIFVATPMYGGMCAGFYTQSILQLTKVCADNGVQLSFSFMFNESLITRARNSLAQTFLKTNCTHLMFIDSDILFDPRDVVTMLQADKDVICGIYPKKEINWNSVRRAMDQGVPEDQLKFHTGSFVVNLVNYAGEVTVPINEPVEIFNGGTGFMMIKREVFDTLRPHVPCYSNDVVDLNKTMVQGDQIAEYFATSIEPETNRLLSEDYHFCRIARLEGIKVWAAPWVNLAHTGSYIFEGQLLRSE